MTVKTTWGKFYKVLEVKLINTVIIEDPHVIIITLIIVVNNQIDSFDWWYHLFQIEKYIIND